MFRIDRNSIRRSEDGESYVILKTPAEIPQESEFVFPEENYEPTPQEPPSEEELAEELEIAKSEAASILEQAKLEADSLLEQAKLEVNSMIAEANMRSDEIKQLAYSEGYENGEQEAARKAEQDMQGELERLKATARELSLFRAKILNEAERDLLDLSLDIAEKILRVELNRDDSAYIGLVKDALSKVKSRGKVAVRVPVRDYELFFAGVNRNLSAGTDGLTVEVMADPDLPENSLIIESQSETIDAGPWKQLGAIGGALMETAGMGSVFDE